MYCASCGAEMMAQASTCEKCGWQVPRTESIGDDPAMRLLFPVGRSWLAIVAGYLGLVSILAFPAPLALLFGILAVVDIRNHPEKHGMGRAIFGIVMGGIFSLVLVILLVALIA